MGSNKTKRILGLNKYMIIFIFVWFLLGVGGTYAYYFFRVEDGESVIVGNIISIDAELEVDLVVGTNGKMVPMNDDALSNAINGVGSTNGACIDRVGNLSCQVYRIKLINKGSKLRHINGSIKLYPEDGDNNSYFNLKWRELTNPTTVKTDSVVNSMRESLLVSDLTIESKETLTWYIAVWLSETDYDQKYSDVGTFGGTVTFETINEDNDLNEYGFYYGRTYNWVTNDGILSLVLYGDRSAKVYIGGDLVAEQPPGAAHYEEGIIRLNLEEEELILYVEENGTVLTDQDDYIRFVLDTSSNGLNAYGFYYDKKYNWVTNDGTLSLVLYEDKSAKIYIDEELMQEVPPGTVSYEKGIIRMNPEDDNSIFYIEENGTVLYDPYDNIRLVLDTSSNGLNAYGFYYARRYNVLFEGTIASFVFYADGSLKLFENGVLLNELPPGTVSYEEGIIRLGETILYIEENGSVINYDGTRLVLEDTGLNGYGFYYNKKYSFAIGDDISTIIFYADGSIAEYQNGVFLANRPSGTASYEVGVITLHLDDANDMILYIEQNGTILKHEEDGINIEMVLEDDLEDDLEDELEGYNDSIFDTEIRVGKTYYLSGPYNYWDGMYIYKLNFYENGTAKIATLYNQNLINEETVFVKYKGNSLKFNDLNNLGECSLSVSNGGMLIGGNCNKDNNINYKFIFGDEFIVEGDYSYFWIGDGWGVKVNDITKSRYDPIRTELNGFPVTNLDYTFYNCINLVTAPVIPSSVTSMNQTFYGCTSLEGNIVINSNNLQTFNNTFGNTMKPIVITGTCPNNIKSSLAATANNGNVTFK